MAYLETGQQMEQLSVSSEARDASILPISAEPSSKNNGKGSSKSNNKKKAKFDHWRRYGLLSVCSNSTFHGIINIQMNMNLTVFGVGNLGIVNEVRNTFAPIKGVVTCMCRAV